MTVPTSADIAEEQAFCRDIRKLSPKEDSMNILSGTLPKWITAGILPAAVFLIPTNAVFTAQLQLFFAITIFFICMLAFELLPTLAAAVILSSMYIISGLVPEAVALKPWTNTVLFMAVCAMYPRLFVCIDRYILMMPGWQAYVQAANYLLQDQLMFGSAYPLHDQKFVRDFYLQAGFRQEVLPKVLYDNAARFLGLEGGYPGVTLYDTFK